MTPEHLHELHDRSLWRYLDEAQHGGRYIDATDKYELTEHIELRHAGYHEVEKMALARLGYGYFWRFYATMALVESGEWIIPGYYVPSKFEREGYEVVSTETGEIAHMPSSIVEVDVMHCRNYEEEVVEVDRRRARGMTLARDLYRNPQKRSDRYKFRSIVRQAAASADRARFRRISSRTDRPRKKYG